MPIRVTPKQLAAMSAGGTPDPLESEIQRAVIAYLDLKGAAWVRVNGGAFKRGKQLIVFNRAKRGKCSDLLVCYRGRFIAMECKREKGKPTAKQSEFLDCVIEAGGVGAIVRGVQDAERVLWAVDQQLGSE